MNENESAGRAAEGQCKLWNPSGAKANKFVRPERRAYRYRLEPNGAQRRQLERIAHARRFAYNWGLARWRDYHAKTGTSIPFKQLLRELTELKRDPEFGWLNDVDSQALQQALFDLGRAYRAFFQRRCGYPRFKSRKSDPQRFRIPQRVRLQGSRVYVPKIGWVKLRLSRPTTGRIKSATFKCEPSGHWFVSLVSEFEVAGPPGRVPKPEDVVGIDLGVKEFAVLSTGVRIDAPRFARRAQRQLRSAHRALSRKQLGSRNRQRARTKLAGIYQRTGYRRADFLHKLSTELVRQFDVVAVEDLGVTGLARTKLASAVLDAGMSEFRRQLAYKARWHGKELVVVDRFFPSTRLCPACGAVNGKLTPRVRHWTCDCGAGHDRDLNAARNVRSWAVQRLVAVGRTDTKNGCGARVRPPTEAAGNEAAIAR